MKTIGKFYMINESNDCHKISFLGEPLPILWNRDGLFRVVPKAVIQNAIDISTDYSHVYCNKTVSPIVGLLWSQGVPISNLAGRALIGE